MDHVDYVYTEGMAAEDVERYLDERGHGVLALARDGDAYAIPIDYHYDGDGLLFRLGVEATSAKLAFADATDTATLVLYDVDDDGDSRSVVVRGPIRQLSASERGAFDDTAINEAFPPFHLFDETVESVDVTLFELTPTEITGRRTVD
jgi:nitroimidazol reductase NimA-like FMN-containing flavoprotein (pyridoxamine 5'-phosphate oxidase superfamily)